MGHHRLLPDALHVPSLLPVCSLPKPTPPNPTQPSETLIPPATAVGAVYDHIAREEGMCMESVRKLFKDSIKSLEADIQHANTLSVILFAFFFGFFVGNWNGDVGFLLQRDWGVKMVSLLVLVWSQLFALLSLISRYF